MRRFTTFAIVMLLSVFIISCSKKDAIDDRNELVGTSWTQKGTGSDFLTIRFSDKENARLVARADGDNLDIPGTYVYNKPNISVRFEDEDSGLDMSGKVNGNALQLSLFIDGDKIEAVFIKD